MTYEQIHNLFKQRYNQTNWKQFLSEAFSKSRLLAKPEILTGIGSPAQSGIASQVQKLGYIVLNENGIERQIAVYEVTLAQGIILERNRVGLRNLLRKYWKNIDAAFIVYHRPETPNWRFTYISELTGYDADGEFVQLKTEPKRYTYILGEGESTRTAAERFTAIANKGSKATLEDVKEAFSVEKLSKAFFDEYKKHYDIFCDFMVASPNIRQTIFNGDEKGIRDFNKKLLGRIVFLYFIQKKGWLGVPAKSDWGKGDFNFLTQQFENFRNKDLFYQDFLSILFFETLNCKRENDIFNYDNSQFLILNSQLIKIPYLNGGLFEEDDQKHRNLIFPANLFKSLFDFFNQYNFTIYEDDPNDHTVAVDPEMLGHIFENLLEDNKDKGAYYTPKEIVHYMCQESLIEYLKTNYESSITNYELKAETAESLITNFIKKKEINIELLEKSSKSKESYKSWFRQLNNALDNVKICDPAIGSGAFPMGLLHEIFTAKQTLHTFEHGNTKTFPASEVKLNIIQNSIYGVDIEKGAVDIARLRFWLSLIVDEEKPKALPNLDYKIVVGNSLVSKLGDDIIDIDWTLNETSHGLFGADLAKQKGELLRKISKEQKEFFSPDSDKKKLAADIRKLKIDLLITQLELMVTTKGIETKPTTTSKTLTKQTELYLQTIGWKNSIKDLQKLKNKPELPLHFFDWKLDFPEVMNEQVTTNVGFDIVIGNPPYVDIKGLPKDSVEIYFKIFQTAENRINLYSIFIEKGFSLVKNSGILSFINPNSILINESYRKIRKHIVDGVQKIIKLPDAIFSTATVETIIIFIAKNSNSDYIQGAYFANSAETILTNIEFKYFNRIDWINDSESRFNIFSDSKTLKILSKIESETKTLDNFVDTSLGITPYDKYKGHSESLIKNREYHSNQKETNEYVPLISGKNIHSYSISNEIDEYLKYGNWLGAPREIKFFTSPKIIVRQILGGKELKIIAGYSELPIYFTQIGFSLISKINNNYEIKFLLGLLNSNLISYYHKHKFLDIEKIVFQKILISNCKNIPIKRTSIITQGLFVSIIDKILSLKSEGKDTTALEQEIDHLVYKLYELTYDEVKVIDPAFSLSKKEYEAIEIK